MWNTWTLETLHSEAAQGRSLEELKSTTTVSNVEYVIKQSNS